MASRNRVVHIVSFIALVANLFAPIATLEVTAQDLSATPEESSPAVSFDEGSNSDEESTSNEDDESEVGGDSDEESTSNDDESHVVPPSTGDEGQDLPGASESLIPVSPQNPVIDESVCSDPSIEFPHMVFAETEGISYSLSDADDIGNRTVIATLQDGFSWNSGALVDWTIDPANPSNSHYNTVVAPCPEIAVAARSGEPEVGPINDLIEVTIPSIDTSTYGSCPGYYHTLGFTWTAMRGMEPTQYQRIYDPFGAAITAGSFDLDEIATFSFPVGPTTNFIFNFNWSPDLNGLRLGPMVGRIWEDGV